MTIAQTIEKFLQALRRVRQLQNERDEAEDDYKKVKQQRTRSNNTVEATGLQYIVEAYQNFQQREKRLQSELRDAHTLKEEIFRALELTDGARMPFVFYPDQYEHLSETWEFWIEDDELKHEKKG